MTIGDGIWDVITAAKLAIGFVGIAQGKTNNKLLQAGAKDVLADFKQIRDFKQALEQAVVPDVI